MRKEAIAFGIVMLMTASLMSVNYLTQSRETHQDIEQGFTVMSLNPLTELGAEETGPETRATWYGEFGYRRLIRLTGDGTTYTNFALRVDLNETMGFGATSFAHVLATGNDMRFTDSTSTEVQPKWREYWNYTNCDATIWVNLSTIADSGYTDYYMYYGDATSTTDTDAPGDVFLHWDTFSGSDYVLRKETQLNGPIDTSVIYKKSSIVRFQPDGETYWYEENNTLMGISIGYQEEEAPKRDTAYDHYLAYGSLWNDSHNYSICGAYCPTTIGGFTRFTNNPLINVSYGEDENPDTIKCTEPDWVTDITANDRKYIVVDDTYSYVIYYAGLNASRYSVCCANSSDATSLDNTYNKQGIMLDAEDVAWATDVRSPVVYMAGESDYRMFFAGFTESEHWEIGYATSTTIVGPWTEIGFPVFNDTAYGYAENSVFPNDVWGNGTQTWLAFAGLDDNLYFRQGIANCSESDPLVTWTNNRGFITYGESGMSDLDQGNCHYGSWIKINTGESTEYLTYYYTCTNATHVSMTNANAYNTSWVAHGTSNANYNLWDLDLDGDVGLFVDTNETYILNDFDDEYVEGGEDYHNLSITAECWMRGSGGEDNCSVIGRGGDATWSSRSHYASELNVSDDDVKAICSLAGTESVIDSDALHTTYATAGEQIQLNLWMMGDEVGAYTENMPDNYTGYANATDENHMNGMVGLLVHNCPIEFDWFRISNAGPSGGASWSFGTEAGQSTTPTGGGGGDDDTDYTHDDNPPNEQDDNLCCSSVILLGIAVATPTTGGIIKYKSRKRDKGLEK